MVHALFSFELFSRTLIKSHLYLESYAMTEINGVVFLHFPHTLEKTYSGTKGSLYPSPELQNPDEEMDKGHM